MILNKHTLIMMIVNNYTTDIDYIDYLINHYAKMNKDIFDSMVIESFNSKIKPFGKFYILN